MSEASTIVQRLWNYCNVLRDDGVSYGDYVEQLTYLLFLKMADEQESLLHEASGIPAGFGWKTLKEKGGDALELHYRHTLETLGRNTGLLGVIFRKAQNKIQDPAKLERLIGLIDGETWMGLGIDVKGEIYEGLLQKNAEDTKSGAGQYFTPRALIDAIVAAVRPAPGQKIADPACGTGGFFLAAHNFLATQPLNRDQKKALREQTFRGWEIVDNTARLCVMNLYLHGIGDRETPVTVADALAADPGERFDLVLTNPPFGKKSSVTIMNEEGKTDKAQLSYTRDDFWATTSNKQLNFLQHITTLLKANGRAAVVVPDNVLFEGGAGEVIRRKLLQTCDVHTLLRLPTGIFYAQGVKANVLFFDRKPAREAPWTSRLWIYDFRTNIHLTLKENPLKAADLAEFLASYNPADRFRRQESDRFKSFTYEELQKRDKLSLDIFWLKDDSLEESANRPAPEIIAQEITDDLEAALEQFATIAEDLKTAPSGR
jgi:type I restriction enzyme M protein